MKKIKLIILLICIVMTGGAFSGCTPKDKPDPTALQIAVIAKGYGSAYAYALAEAYQKKTDGAVKVQVVADTPEPGFVTNSLSTGPDNNEIDIYFHLYNDAFSQLSQDMGITGYSGFAWEDLSEVYNAPAVGYAESAADPTLTYGDLLNQKFVEMYTYKDGRQYAVPWSAGLGGLMYNQTLWNETNARLTAAGQSALDLPKTTTEMFTLFDRIKGLDGSLRNNAYAFSYSGVNNYMHYLFGSLWPQYDGIDKAYAFLEGKNEAGQYTADIYDTKGRFNAYETARSMILKTNGYVHANDISTIFTQSQLNFLKKRAFFNLNGDWLEREASSQFKPGEADISYLRTPVISDVVNNPKIAADFTGTAAEKDVKLRGVIDYIDKTVIDGETGISKPSGVSDATIAFLTDSRLVQYCEPMYTALVPAYSNQKKEAKDFLKYMLSKEGQEVFMKSANGVAAPLSVDPTQFDYYGEASVFVKSKLNLMQNWKPMPVYSNTYPIQYMGGATFFRGDGQSMAVAFGTIEPMTAKSYYDSEVEYFKGAWPKMMTDAGLSN